MKRKSNFLQLAFNDLLFNLVLAFVSLFVIALLYVNPIGEKKDQDIPSKAEYIIVMTWDSGIDVDMDLWVKTDQNVVVGFKFKDKDFIHLERDDLGNINDQAYHNIQTQSQNYINNNNEEIIVFRASPKGTYTVNAHYYRGHYVEQEGSVSEILYPTVTVEIKLIRVNPSYKVIFVSKKEMNKHRQEITFMNFDINEDGDVELYTINQLQNLFVNRILESMQ